MAFKLGGNKPVGGGAKIGGGKPGGLKIGGNKLGGGKPSGGNSLAQKFQKRSTTVLEKTYNTREERSKGASGKSIFNEELLAEFGIEKFTPVIGDNYIEILPQSFDPNVEYFEELAVHFGVGVSSDAYICPQRYNRKPCYRCEKQAELYKDHPRGVPPTQAIKDLYPSDRVVYLVWNRTTELTKNEAPKYKLSIWAAPKGAIHQAIQTLVRDKRSRTFLDISDVQENGDGRTITFDMQKKGKGDYPDYLGIQLLEREEIPGTNSNAIPEEILEQLSAIIEAAEAKGYKKAVDILLHIPDYDEIRHSMTVGGKEESESKASGGKGKDSTQQEESSEDDAELVAQLEEMKEALSSAPPLLFVKKFTEIAKENDVDPSDYIAAFKDKSNTKEEVIDAFINDLYESANAANSGMSDVPF